MLQICSGQVSIWRAFTPVPVLHDNDRCANLTNALGIRDHVKMFSPAYLLRNRSRDGSISQVPIVSRGSDFTRCHDNNRRPWTFPEGRTPVVELLKSAKARVVVINELSECGVTHR